MDDDNGAEETVTAEELEQMRRALRMELGMSEDGSSDESEEDDDKSTSDEDDSSEEEEEISKKNDQEAECPAKRRRQENNERLVDVDATSCERTPSNAEQGANPLKRLKRVPECSSGDLVLPLPDGWIQTIHDSGVPIYLHKETRVVTLSRPYELKNDSLRRQSIPIDSIPCELQRRIADRRNKTRVLSEGTHNETVVPGVQFKTGEERMSVDELYGMAKDLFRIKDTMVYDSKDFKLVREHKKRERMEGMKDEDVVDIDVKTPLVCVEGVKSRKVRRQGWVLHIAGKRSTTLLHEYAQKVLRGRIEFTFADLKSTIVPFSGMAFLKVKKEKSGDGDVGEDGYTTTLIGRASAETKKIAKARAASSALRSLIPGINIDDRDIVKGNMSDTENVEMLDLLSIEDPKVIEYSKKTGIPVPYRILKEAIKMNTAWGMTDLEETSRLINHRTHEVVLKVGNHEARAECSKLYTGRQMAAQSLLKKLYPMLETWGSIYRLFSSSINDLETARVTDKVNVMAPAFGMNHKGKDYLRNEDVLAALRSEMKRVDDWMKGNRRVEREKGLTTTFLSVGGEMETESAVEIIPLPHAIKRPVSPTSTTMLHWPR